MCAGGERRRRRRGETKYDGSGCSFTRIGSRQFSAHVSSIQPAADPETQRYTIVLQLDQAPDNLMAGMTGE